MSETMTESTGMDQLTGESVRADAQEKAIAIYTVHEHLGVPPLTTATAAAMLIGWIIGSAARDEVHMQEGLDDLTKIARLTANNWLHGMKRMRN